MKIKNNYEKIRQEVRFKTLPLLAFDEDGSMVIISVKSHYKNPFYELLTVNRDSGECTAKRVYKNGRFVERVGSWMQSYRDKTKRFTDLIVSFGGKDRMKLSVVMGAHNRYKITVERG